MVKVEESMADDLKPKEVDAWLARVPEGVSRLRVGDNLYLEARKKSPEEDASASWSFRWNVNGKGQSLSLGKYKTRFKNSQPVSLANARRAADTLRASLAAGNKTFHLDARNENRRKIEEEQARKEAAEKAQERATRTVERACRDWHSGGVAKLTSPKYAAQRMRRLEDFFPFIGGKPVDELTVKDVAGAFKFVRAAMAKRNGRGDGLETLRRSSADLEKALAYAAGEGWFTGMNPVTQARTNLDKPKTEGRRHFAVERLGEFWRAVHAAGEGQRYPVTVQLLKLLTLTGARTLEVRGLRWDEVKDLDGKAPVINVPASRMKRREAWIIPITPSAAEILRTVRDWQTEAGASLRGVKDGLVFVHLEGNYKGRGLSENAVNDLLRAMGWGEALTAHGLRKVFSTVAHDAWTYHGPNREIAIEYSLAHAPADKVRGIYDKNDFTDKRRELLTWWAGQLDEAAAIAAAKPGTVVQLRRAA